MLKRWIVAAVVLAIGVFLSLGVLGQAGEGTYWARHPYHLGLDLSGGSHLIYKADVSTLPAGEINDSMDALRDVIERRINLLGVGEPIVQVQTSTLTGQKEYRLSIELPGITDINEAKEMIGETPFLEFRTQSDKPQKATVGKDGNLEVDPLASFVATDLTGKYLKRATLVFDPSTSEPIVSLQFDDEGAKLFEKITGENIGKVVAIYLDGQVISAPVVREAIPGGEAQISGQFTPSEAKELVGRLNSGALPVPIANIFENTIGATLGADAIASGQSAALIGFAIVALFLLVWYRLPGLVAVLALAIYVILTLTLYRLIPVTLTAAGIAGFIISIGMAVDANILIFERAREERQKGKGSREAMRDGFSRAWFSIRDGNTAAIITSIILFWFGTSLIKGFALTLGLGVAISLVSAITVTRVFLEALPTLEGTRIGRLIFSSGFAKK